MKRTAKWLLLSFYLILHDKCYSSALERDLYITDDDKPPEEPVSLDVRGHESYWQLDEEPPAGQQKPPDTREFMEKSEMQRMVREGDGESLLEQLLAGREEILINEEDNRRAEEIAQEDELSRMYDNMKSVRRDSEQQQREDDDDDDDDEDDDQRALHLDNEKRNMIRKMREYVDRMMKKGENEDDDDDDELTRRGEACPESYGVDVSLMASTHPAKQLRPGRALKGTMCNRVIPVPNRLRNVRLMWPGGIPDHYQKYTQAYGIPIIGSNNVTDEGMKRACYVVRFVFSCRYDSRNIFFLMYGRVAIIGEGEFQTTLPEYSDLDSTYWDARARGLGGTVQIPVCSVGDENLRCAPSDKYPKQDIMLHEFAHGLHLISSAYAVRGFSRELGEIYRKDLATGKWKDEYASKTPNELLAMGATFYYDALSGLVIRPTGSAIDIEDHTSLQKYDAPLYNLLKKIVACRDISTFVERCDYKKSCTLQANFELQKTFWYSKCKRIARDSKSPSIEACAEFTCSSGGTGFNFRAPKYCYVVKCEDPSDMLLSEHRLEYHVYKLTKVPEMGQKEKSHPMPGLCVTGPDQTARCTGLKSTDKTNPCGPPGTISHKDCADNGCCWHNNECVYPIQDCYDRNIFCPEMAVNDGCNKNPLYMILHCPYNCDECAKNKQMLAKNTEASILSSGCMDKHQSCEYWKNQGLCNSNGYVKANCKVTCGSCTVNLNQYL